MEDNKLYMPSNISTETEIIKGITKKELKHLGYLLIIAGVISFIFFITINLQVCAITFVILAAFSYLSVIKTSDGNFSMIKLIIGMYKYHTEQRCYKYKYKDFWSELSDEKTKK